MTKEDPTHILNNATRSLLDKLRLGHALFSEESVKILGIAVGVNGRVGMYKSSVSLKRSPFLKRRTSQLYILQDGPSEGGSRVRILSHFPLISLHHADNDATLLHLCPPSKMIL